MNSNGCIDIGNTRVKIGLFVKEQLIESVQFENSEQEKILAYLTNQKMKNIIFSTVIDPLPMAIGGFLKHHKSVLQLTHETPLPIRNSYNTPNTLGKDRLAAVLGAYALFPGANCLIIDSGTCITYDFLSADATYLGGNISPGWQMRLDAMAHFTNKLPRPEPQIPDLQIGNSTKSALQNGAYFGLLFEIEGYIQKVKEKYEPVNVLLTGGDADFFAKNVKSQIFVNQNLVLQGLNKILTYNV